MGHVLGHVFDTESEWKSLLLNVNSAIISISHFAWKQKTVNLQQILVPLPPYTGELWVTFSFLLKSHALQMPW